MTGRKSEICKRKKESLKYPKFGDTSYLFSRFFLRFSLFFYFKGKKESLKQQQIPVCEGSFRETEFLSWQLFDSHESYIDSHESYLTVKRYLSCFLLSAPLCLFSHNCSFTTPRKIDTEQKKVCFQHRNGHNIPNKTRPRRLFKRFRSHLLLMKWFTLLKKKWSASRHFQLSLITRMRSSWHYWKIWKHVMT